MGFVWYRADGSGNVMEPGEVPDGLLDEGFPQASRPLDEIDRFLGNDFRVEGRDRDELLISCPVDADGMQFRTLVRRDQWLAAHPEGGIVVFDESELA